MADTLRNISAQMANVIFNLAQRPGDALTGDLVAKMDSLRKQWDAAVRAIPPLPSTAPEVDELPSDDELRKIWRLANSEGIAAWGKAECDTTRHVWQMRKVYESITRAALASRPAEASLKPMRERENAESLQRARPAEVDDEGLPPLPESLGMGMLDGQELPAYSAEQYRQGQRDAVAADRARRGGQS